jgi:hypothetical protein
MPNVRLESATPPIDQVVSDVRLAIFDRSPHDGLPRTFDGFERHPQLRLA